MRRRAAPLRRRQLELRDAERLEEALGRLGVDLRSSMSTRRLDAVAATPLEDIPDAGRPTVAKKRAMPRRPKSPSPLDSSTECNCGSVYKSSTPWTSQTSTSPSEA